jgi:hypothetical protein
MKRVLLAGITLMFLFTLSAPAIASRIPENPLVSCGDCRNHYQNPDEGTVDDMNPPAANYKSDMRSRFTHRDMTRIVLRLIRLTYSW